MQVLNLLSAVEMVIIVIARILIIQRARAEVEDLEEGEMLVDIETILLPLMDVEGIWAGLVEVLMGLDWVMVLSEVMACLEATLMSARGKEIGCALILCESLSLSCYFVCDAIELFVSSN